MNKSINDFLMENEEIIYEAKPQVNAFIKHPFVNNLPRVIRFLIIGYLIATSTMHFIPTKIDIVLAGAFFLVFALPLLYRLFNLATVGLRYQHEHYYLTDQRIIISSGLFKDNFRSVNLNDIHQMSLLSGGSYAAYDVISIDFDYIVNRDERQAYIRDSILYLEENSPFYEIMCEAIEATHQQDADFQLKKSSIINNSLQIPLKEDETVIFESYTTLPDLILDSILRLFPLVLGFGLFVLLFISDRKYDEAIYANEVLGCLIFFNALFTYRYRFYCVTDQRILFSFGNVSSGYNSILLESVTRIVKKRRNLYIFYNRKVNDSETPADATMYLVKDCDECYEIINYFLNLNKTDDQPTED